MGTKKQEEERKGIDLGPESWVEGGGLLDNVDVLFKECRFAMWDYNKTQPERPALKITFGVGEGDDVDQYLSLGDAAAGQLEPSDDGTELVPIGPNANITKGCNYSIFMKSLIEAGFPAPKLGNDISILDGLEAHVVRIPAPKRAGISQTKTRADGRTFEQTNLVVDKIIKLPWEKKGGKTGGGGKKTEEAEGGDVNDKATAYVLSVLASEEYKGKEVDKRKLIGVVFNLAKTDPDRNAISKLLNSDEFLSAGPWTFEGGKVS